MKASRAQQPAADAQPMISSRASSIALAKKQALEALALAQFGLERASAAIEEVMRRLQAVDEAPLARPEAICPNRDSAAPAGISPNQLLKLSEVKQMVGLASSTICRRVGDGESPKPLQLGPQTVRWRRGDLGTWLASLKTIIERPKQNPGLPMK